MTDIKPKLETSEAEIARLTTITDRLRGKYVVPVNDGAGLLDGKDTFTREFQTPPIQHEAAARIEELEAQHDKITEFIGRFLVPYRTEIARTWLDGFVECGAVTIDWSYPYGFVAPVKIKP